MTVPGVDPDASPTLIAAGPDGTVWFYLWDKKPPAGNGHLARFADGTWTAYHQADGVPIVRDFYGGFLGFIAAGPDGRVWLAPQSEPQIDDCGGVTTFDGTTWTSYLEDACVVDLDVAPDGTVWVQTAVRPEGAQAYVAGGTYLITPPPLAAAVEVPGRD